MGIGTFNSILKITRIDTSIIAGLTIFIPALLWSGDIKLSLGLSLPILTTSMGGFVLNDIFDAEKDAINHPERPLPSNIFSPEFAMILYLLLLAVTLILVKVWVPLDKVFYYLAFFLLFANYNFVVEKFPAYKNIYVAFSAAVPLFIVSSFQDNIAARYLLPVCLILFLVGREILMDYVDQKGDGHTFIKILGETAGINIAFFAQSLGIMILCLFAKSTIEVVSSILLVGTVMIFYWLVISKRKVSLVIHLMKFQSILGIPFLLP